MDSSQKQTVRDEILRIVINHEEGVGRASILKYLEIEISERTLQRRLSELELAGDIGRIGGARSIRYLARTPGDPGESSIQIRELVLSDQAEEIRREVDLPEVRNRRVTYNFAFLEGYVPGKSWYLDKQTRLDLTHKGSVFEEVMPAGTYARQIINQLMIDLSWASSYLEGNTYTFLDTRLLLEKGQVAKGKDAKETQMILNHKSAIEIMVENDAMLEFNRGAILNLHAILSQGLLTDYRDEGRLRQHVVSIGGTNYTPLSMSQQIEDYFNMLLEKSRAIPDPLEQAFFFMMQLAYLQPFADVNKRVARVGANIPLIKANLCPLSFMDVPRDLLLKGLMGVYLLNRYELLREVFVFAYGISADRYKIVRDRVVEPDLNRLKYRTELFDWVRRVVLDAKPVSRDQIHGFLFGEIPEEDWALFEELLLEEVLNLHEGNYLRYGIRQPEFTAWNEIQ